MTCGIYGIFNSLDGKVYVGSSANIARRWRHHKLMLTTGKHRNAHLLRAWSAYGADVFEFRVLEECPESMLVVREDAWMEYHGSLNPQNGYNMKSASRTVVTEELRQRLSEVHRGKVASVETRKRMSQAAKLRRGTAEARLACSLQFKGKPKSPEQRLKMSLAARGKKKSATARKRMSESAKRRVARSLDTGASS